MKYLILFLVSVVTFLLTFGFMIFHNKTVIRFKTHAYEWIFPIIFSFLAISLAILAEILINYNIQNIQGKTIALIVVKQAVEDGVLLLIILSVFSYFLGKFIERNNLDLNLVYEEKTSKFIITMGIIVSYAFLFCYFSSRYSLDNSDVDMIVTRLRMWLINVAGIWFSAGGGCQGRINAYRLNEYNSRKHTDRRMSIRFYATIIICMMFVTGFYVGLFPFIDLIGAYGAYSTICELFAFVSAIGAYVAYDFVIQPSKKVSDRRLSRKISKVSDKKLTGHYENISYKIYRKHKKIVVTVQAKEVIYTGHESELRELFTKKKKVFKEQGAYKKIRKFLRNVAQSRREYIHNAFDECKRNVINDLERMSLGE